jgi:hypothetical protein
MLLSHSRVYALLLVALFCASSVFAAESSNIKRREFQKELASVVSPIQGNEAGILSTAEAKFIQTFQEPAQDNASYESYFYSNDVGGILLRNQPLDPNASLKLESVTFELDESKNPAVVTINLAAAGEEVTVSVEASLIALAARLAADNRLVLLSMAAGSGSGNSLTAEEMLAIHPAISRHRLAVAAAIVDDSFGAPLVEAAYWVLSETAWPLSIQSFDNSSDLFTLECRGLLTKIEITNLTTRWKRTLNPKQIAALEQVNDFIAVYRLVNAAVEGYLEGFPEQEFISLLKRIQPHYEAQAVTNEEEQQFHQWLSRR